MSDWMKAYSLRRVACLLLFHDSRKVAFGLWVFITATVLISFRRLDGVQWIECVGLASLLIGGGTLTDAWLRKKPDAAPAPPTP